ncbi:MAG: hypothetical protein JWR00_4761 [Rubritepida sp.]|nr:hypothetical protein [Rubritepida sp.]
MRRARRSSRGWNDRLLLWPGTSACSCSENSRPGQNELFDTGRVPSRHWIWDSRGIDAPRSGGNGNIGALPGKGGMAHHSLRHRLPGQDSPLLLNAMRPRHGLPGRTASIARAPAESPGSGMPGDPANVMEQEAPRNRKLPAPCAGLPKLRRHSESPAGWVPSRAFLLLTGLDSGSIAPREARLPASWSIRPGVPWQNSVSFHAAAAQGF